MPQARATHHQSPPLADVGHQAAGTDGDGEDSDEEGEEEGEYRVINR